MGVPICCVVKRTNFDDYHGIQSYRKKDFQKAYNLLVKAYEYDPNNYVIYPYLSGLYFQSRQYQKAVEIANKQLDLFPNDKNAKRIIDKVKNLKKSSKK